MPIGLARPLALLGLLILVPFAMAWGHAYVRHRRADEAYGGSPALRRSTGAHRRLLRGGLLVLVVVLAVFAMARPRWGTHASPVQRQGIDVVVALDISRSMQATDIQPSRAGAAAAGLHNMLGHLDGDRVGLVTFGGSAFVRSPLTLDLDAMDDLVTRAQRENSLVQPGTDIGAAITTALQVLDVPDKAGTQLILLISDGEDLGTKANAGVAAAKQKGIHVYTVAAGTEQGAPVPSEVGATPGANSIISHADRTTLARIAVETGGKTRDITTLAGLAVDFARLRQTALDQDVQHVPVERFQWLLAAAFVLLLLDTVVADGSRTRDRRTASLGKFGRRAAVATGLLATVLLIGCGGTAAYRKVEAGNHAFGRGQFAQALTAYTAASKLAPNDPVMQYDIGNTLHRLQRYDEAAAASKTAATTTKDGVVYARAMYAIGNDAFQRNSMTEARDAYIAVLQRNPSDNDARHNLELVLADLQPPPPTNQGGQNGPQPSGIQPSGSPSPDNSGPGQAPPQGTTPGTNGGQPQNGQPGTGQSGSQPDSESAARARLQQALKDLTGTVTPEEALRILDAARQASEQGTLAQPGNSNPNDR